jgi:hypothetical protein
VPEDLEEFLVADLCGVIDDFHRFGMTSATCRDLLIGGIQFFPPL